MSFLWNFLVRSRDYAAHTFGLKVARVPRILARNPEAELSVTLDLILSHYRQFHPKVSFLQIGAFDGVSGDPLYPLIEKHGLSGVLVEPQPDAFRKLTNNYARFEEGRFTLVNAAIGPHDGTIPFNRIKAGPEWLHQLASFDKSVIMKHAGSVPNLKSLITTEEVPCFTFATLFKTLGIEKIDLLQVDAEGYDAEILKLFDTQAHQTPIIHFEHRHLRRGDYEECISGLIREGYSVALSKFDTLAYRHGF